jgi:metallophosphoesterase superfamily enzyme
MTTQQIEAGYNTNCKWNFLNEDIYSVKELSTVAITNKLLQARWQEIAAKAHNAEKGALQDTIAVHVNKLKKVFSEHEKQSQVPAKPMATNNILVVGDLHAPFTLAKYLDFCYKQYQAFNCSRVVFIGDLIDNHAVSYHEKNANAMGAKTELEKAIDQLKLWYKVFPKADVILGNHDLLFARKLNSAGLPSKVIKDFAQIIEAPATWSFHDKLVANNILFIHGTGLSEKTIRNKSLEEQLPVVMGHLHTSAGVEHFTQKLWGMRVGCGIDNEAYAFDYNKLNTKKPVISCGIIAGHIPVVLPLC